MYSSIYANQTYGSYWSALVCTFTATGGGLVGGSVFFIAIVDSPMVGGEVSGGLASTIIFDLDIVGESRSALGLVGIIRPIESLIGIP